MNRDYLNTIINALKQFVPPFVKPDWDENDETSPNFIKGRTHYKKNGKVAKRIDAEFLPASMPSSYQAEVNEAVNSAVNSGVEQANANARSMLSAHYCSWLQEESTSSATELRYKPFGSFASTRRVWSGGWTPGGATADFRILATDPSGTNLRENNTITLRISYYVGSATSYAVRYVSAQILNKEVLHTQDGVNCCIWGAVDIEGYQLEGPLLVYATRPGWLKFYDKNNVLKFEAAFLLPALYALSHKVPENSTILKPNSNVYIESCDATYRGTFLQHIPQDFLPVKIQQIYMDRAYDTMVPGDFVMIPSLAKSLNLDQTTTDYSVPIFFLLDGELIVRVTNFLPSHMAPCLPDDASTRVSYRLDFVGDNVRNIDGKVYLDHIEGSIVSRLKDDLLFDLTFANRFYLTAHSLSPITFPNYTQEDEGKVLSIVDGVPKWVEPVSKEDIFGAMEASY